MLKNFALAAIIAFADAVQLECCPSCSGPDEEDWEESIEKILNSSSNQNNTLGTRVLRNLMQCQEKYENQ